MLINTESDSAVSPDAVVAAGFSVFISKTPHKSSQPKADPPHSEG